MEKTYNPFKMWGSWAGLFIGMIGALLYMGSPSLIRDLTEFTIISNPIIWLAGWPTLPIVMTTPIVMFIYGWGIHSLFRKLGRVGRVAVIIAIILPVIIGSAYTYISSKQSFQAALNSADVDIHSPSESVAMNAVMVIAQAETNNLVVIDKMLAIARDSSLVIDVRLTALDSLDPKIGTMSPSEKKILSDDLVVFSDEVNKSSQLSSVDKERMNNGITILQKSLAK